MATNKGIQEAAALITESLPRSMRLSLRARVVYEIRRSYGAQIDVLDDGQLLSLAAWAAARISRISIEDFERNGTQAVFYAFAKSDCPLCVGPGLRRKGRYSGNGNEGGAVN